MLIHSYLTNGESMFKFALLFLESFRYYHGQDIKIVFSGRNLDKGQEEKLKKEYRNLDILNEKFDYKKLSEKTGYSYNYLRNLKNNIENGINISGKKDYVLMKQFISVEDRYRTSIADIMEKYNNFGHILHFDIDICFFGNLNPLFEIIKENDVSFKFRKNNTKKNRLIVGYALGFTVGENSRKFIDKWYEHIDKLSLENKPKGYGQASLYYTYKDLKNKIKFGEIPAWITGNKDNYNKGKKAPLILSGNKGTKNDSIKIFKGMYKWKT